MIECIVSPLDTGLRRLRVKIKNKVGNVEGLYHDEIGMVDGKLFLTGLLKKNNDFPIAFVALAIDHYPRTKLGMQNFGADTIIAVFKRRPRCRLR